MHVWVSFRRGLVAGAVSLFLLFIISLGGFAPFPPEAAIERFVAFVPASVEQPMVQTFGDAAIYVGVLVATLIAVAFYGLFGSLFERYYVRIVAGISYLTRLEKFLLFSFVPWLFFGAIVLPLSGYGFFGIKSFEPGIASLYPYTLLLASGVYSLLLFYEYRDEPLFLTRSRSAAATGIAVTVSDNTAPKSVESESESESQIPASSSPRFASRREFVEKGVLVAGALIFGALGMGNIASLFSSGVGSGIRNGAPSPPISGIFSDPRLSALVDSEITNNGSFYVVDIDPTPPFVEASSWDLLIKRSGNQLKAVSLSEIEDLAKTEQYTTFECVSNTVDGNLISNAKWTGVKLSNLFDYAGADLSGADYVVFYSVDSYSVGIPISKALLPDSIAAYLMNDQPLPAAHGYPLRAVIPGLYGMMSAKWISEIDIVDSTYIGYWQTRGYTNNATIKTVSFIRVPQDNQVLSLAEYSGSVVIGGMAFAGDRGISKVEVSLDGGRTWHEATLKPPISDLSWTLWAIEFTDLSLGSYNVYARATDGTGLTQTFAKSAPFPSGASGYAGSSFTVAR